MSMIALEKQSSMRKEIIPTQGNSRLASRPVPLWSDGLLGVSGLRPSWRKKHSQHGVLSGFLDP